MAVRDEEQLLSNLLNRIAREDACLNAAHLEGRVVEACSAGTTVRRRADRTYLYFAVAAAVMMAALAPGIAWMKRNKPVHPTEVKIGATVSQSPSPTRVVSAPRATAGKPTNPTNLTNPTNPVNPANPTHPPSVDEFVPLMPMTEQDLAGPFQLVRVQMPRAALGALRSPLDHPDEMVEADVLLGEDGMARAIRVSTSGAVYPWRPR